MWGPMHMLSFSVLSHGGHHILNSTHISNEEQKSLCCRLLSIILIKLAKQGTQCSNQQSESLLEHYLLTHVATRSFILT